MGSVEFTTVAARGAEAALQGGLLGLFDVCPIRLQHAVSDSVAALRLLGIVRGVMVNPSAVSFSLREGS